MVVNKFENKPATFKEYVIKDILYVIHMDEMTDNPFTEITFNSILITKNFILHIS